MGSFFAKSYEVTNNQCYVDGVLQASQAACDQALKTFLGIGLAILVPFLIIGFLLFILWIVTLVHAIKHEDITDRTIWLVGLIASFFLGFSGLLAIIYYFAVQRPYNKKSSQPAPSLQQPTSTGPETQPPITSDNPQN